MSPGPLAGRRVVELSRLGGAYGARVLAALGAEVIKVEPPGGDPIRRMEPRAPGVTETEAGLWWAYLSAGKKSVVLDVEDRAGAEDLAALVATADVVLGGGSPDAQNDRRWGFDVARAANPELTWVAITPFGLTGPRRDWVSSDLIAWSACGLTYTVGFPDRPPLAPAPIVQVAMHYVSLNAAIGALLALRARRRTGAGQLVDLSVQEVMLSMAPETGLPLYLDDQVPRPRAGNRRPVTSPFGLFPCQDGYVAILVLQLSHWQAMASWIHEQTGIDGVRDEVFDDITVRNEASEIIDEWTEAVTRAGTKRELFVEGQRRGIPITPVNTVADLRTDDHLAQAGWWRTEDSPTLGPIEVPGSPFLVDHDWWLWSAAPTLGQHDEEILGPLRG